MFLAKSAHLNCTSELVWPCSAKQPLWYKPVYPKAFGGHVRPRQPRASNSISSSSRSQGQPEVQGVIPLPAPAPASMQDDQESMQPLIRAFQKALDMAKRFTGQQCPYGILTGEIYQNMTVRVTTTDGSNTGGEQLWGYDELLNFLNDPNNAPKGGYESADEDDYHWAFCSICLEMPCQCQPNMSQSSNLAPMWPSLGALPNTVGHTPQLDGGDAAVGPMRTSVDWPLAPTQPCQPPPPLLPMQPPQPPTPPTLPAVPSVPWPQQPDPPISALREDRSTLARHHYHHWQALVPTANPVLLHIAGSAAATGPHSHVGNPIPGIIGRDLCPPEGHDVGPEVLIGSTTCQPLVAQEVISASLLKKQALHRSAMQWVNEHAASLRRSGCPLHDIYKSLDDIANGSNSESEKQEFTVEAKSIAKTIMARMRQPKCPAQSRRMPTMGMTGYDPGRSLSSFSLHGISSTTVMQDVGRVDEFYNYVRCLEVACDDDRTGDFHKVLLCASNL